MHTCAGELALNLLVNIDESVEDFSHCGLAFSHLCQVNTHTKSRQTNRQTGGGGGFPFVYAPPPRPSE